MLSVLTGNQSSLNKDISSCMQTIIWKNQIMKTVLPGADNDIASPAHIRLHREQHGTNTAHLIAGSELLLEISFASSINNMLIIKFTSICFARAFYYLLSAFIECVAVTQLVCVFPFRKQKTNKQTNYRVV